MRYAAILSDRIGHFALNTELYLCEIDAGLREAPDAYFFERTICNHQLARMWQRTLYFARSEPSPGDIVDPMYHAVSTLDTHHLLRRFPPHLSFTDEEEEIGRECMASWGVTEPFVCLQARDRRYGIEIMDESDGPGYHDYRNVDIEDYVPAAEALADIGYHVLRMGHLVENPLLSDHPRVHDYACTNRSDFMDIWLSANCAFMWSTGTGIDGVSAIFRRPVLFTDFIPPGFISEWDERNVQHNKHLYRDGVELTPEEAREVGYFSTAEYRENGLVIGNLTPSELTAAVTGYARGLC